MEKRFYISKSCIYGLTVYDRESQTPAFKYGAETDMAQVVAFALSAKLNMADYKGLLDRFHVSNATTAGA
jgi:hypothetical protein